MEQNNRARFGWEESDSDQEEQISPPTTCSLPGGPCAGTSLETSAQVVAFFQQSETTQAEINNEISCMICLGNIYDLAFRTTVYNMVRNINGIPMKMRL